MWKKTIAIVTIAIALLFGFARPDTAIAQTVSCNPAGNTAEMRACAAEDYDAADKQLNQIYQQVLSQLNQEPKTRLIEAQRAWIDFRDKTCNYEAAKYLGGTLEPLQNTQCKARVTAERVNYLERYGNLSAEQPPNGGETKNKSPEIGSLPDGNYRYASAQIPKSIITDEDLVNAGGFYFLFRKKGDQVTGTYAEIDSENVICINGNVNANTVSGQAVEYSEPPYKKATVVSSGENFVTWDKAGALKVRRGKDLGNKVRYTSALLDLSGFKRYNAGTQLPPMSCP